MSDFLARVEEGYNVIPLFETLQLDRETPVSLYQRFDDGRAIFLLESASLAEVTGRYSFIGLDRKWRVRAQNGHTTVEGANIAGDDGPLQTIRSLLRQYRVLSPHDLPDFFGGAVGFVAYDYVRRLESLPKAPAEDMWPDVDFSFPGATLICDHLRHSTTVVVNVVVENGVDPKGIFHDAIKQLDEIIDILLAPAPQSDPTTERLVATAPTLRHKIEIRSIASALSNFSKEQYCAVVERAKGYIHAGDVFQVVPSQQFRRRTNVNPLTLYRVLRALNPSPYMYLLDSGENQIVGASPEMLLKVRGRELETHPIAGTRPRDELRVYVENKASLFAQAGRSSGERKAALEMEQQETKRPVRKRPMITPKRIISVASNRLRAAAHTVAVMLAHLREYSAICSTRSRLRHQQSAAVDPQQPIKNSIRL